MSKHVAQVCAQVMCLAVLAAEAAAGDIYRWIDDKGRTHVSDRVPDAHKDKATRTDSRKFELTPQQRAEAERRAARERAEEDRARREALERERKAETNRPESPKKPGSAASGAAQPAKAETDCERRWRLYIESQKCFGPYRVYGGIRAEAHQHCVEYPDPSRQCGNLKPATLPDGY